MPEDRLADAVDDGPLALITSDPRDAAEAHEEHGRVVRLDERVERIGRDRSERPLGDVDDCQLRPRAVLRRLHYPHRPHRHHPAPRPGRSARRLLRHGLASSRRVRSAA